MACWNPSDSAARAVRSSSDSSPPVTAIRTDSRSASLPSVTATVAPPRVVTVSAISLSAGA